MATESVPMLPTTQPSTRSLGSCKLDRSGSSDAFAGGDGCEHVHNSLNDLVPDGLRATCFLQRGGDEKAGKKITRKLLIACSLSATFMVIEVIGGYISGSVAVMADAAHMFSDVLSFVVSAYCTYLVAKRASTSYSFGYHRAETVGALISILIICVITGALVLEAGQRLIAPKPIDGRLMFIIATIGIGFNLLLLLTLGHDHHHHGHGHDHHDHGCGSSRHGSHSHCGERLQHGATSVRMHHSRDSREALLCASNTCEAGHAHGEVAAGLRASACSHGVPSCSSSLHRVEAQHGVNGSLKEYHDVTLLEHATNYSEGATVESDALLSHDVVGHGSPKGGCSDGHGHHHHHHENQNMRGAILHVLGDILQSIGVALAGLVIWLTDGSPRWLWVDPVCTFLFAISVIWVTKSLIIDVMSDLMEAAPAHINLEDLLEKLEAVDNVARVHDMHVWTIGTGKHILTAHVDAEDESHPYELVERLERIINAHGIHHTTVQICSGRVHIP